MSDEKKIQIKSTVADVLNSRKLVINKGREDGVKFGQIFLVFQIGQEIIDPESGMPLEKLEIIKGRGRVTYVQNKIATLEAYEENFITAFTTLGSLYGDNKGSTANFEHAEIGDKAYLIS